MVLCGQRRAGYSKNSPRDASPGRKTEWSMPRWIGRTLSPRARAARRAFPRRAGDGQDEAASPGRPAVDPASIGALGTREELGRSSCWTSRIVVAADWLATGGTMTLRGKCSTSRPAKRRVMLRRETEARVIAGSVHRSTVTRGTGHELHRKTVDVRRRSTARDAAVEPPTRPRARTSSRAQVSLRRYPRHQGEKADAYTHYSLAAAAAMYASSCRRAASFQVNCGRRASPFSRDSSAGSSASRMPAAIDSGSAGRRGRRHRRRPRDRPLVSAAATGQPDAIASSGGSPNPRYRLGTP